ncbi:MAG: glycerol-3-phosphate 1-O-acyltransferase PlsB [Proteobacteria bacterium]|nr:glycerol-3-phosphate 1-O-acyltransferase PlsB [Pseudomonadota bacterium]
MSILSKLLYLRIKVKIIPDDLASLGIDKNLPIIYVLDTDSLVSRMVLKTECEKHQLSYKDLPQHWPKLTNVMANKRLTGFWSRQASYTIFQENLGHVLTFLKNHTQEQVQLVPVSVFLGMAPNKNTGIFKILFSEQWSIGGRLRKFFSILIHGKNTLLRFSQPIMLNQELDGSSSVEGLTLKISKVLSTHFYRVKTSVVGPDLSHRRTVAKNILTRAKVVDEIEHYAKRKKLTKTQAHKEAKKIIREIASDYSYSIVSLFAKALTRFWTKVYNGVVFNHFEEFRAKSQKYAVIYTPCHRSHIDYVIMSYALHERGVVPPHIAAGINLNMPIMGSILRKSGAFFIRRSFNSALYSTIFSEYLSALLTHGVSIEYFIEGTRSRTGRLLQPKAGMLAMTINSYLNERNKPLMFQPSTLNYEKLMEGNSYQNELGGKSKKGESLRGLIRARKLLKQNYGRLTVNFSEPIFLDDMLDEYKPDWREITLSHNKKPEWFKQLVKDCGNKIMQHINASAHVNPINLLAITLLSTPNHAASVDNLSAQIEFYKELLIKLPYSSRVTITSLTTQEIFALGIKLGFVEIVEHELGNVVRAKTGQGILLTYYRNNIIHLFAASSFIAMSLINQRQLPRREILRLMGVIYPYVKKELYLHWSSEEFINYGRETLAVLKELDVLKSAGRNVERLAGGTIQAGKLRVLAHALMQTYERFFIVIAVLSKSGSQQLTVPELENLCHKTASKLNLIYGFNSPDYFDKSLFKSFIANLKQEQVIDTDAQGKILFTENLKVFYLGAKRLLSRRIRHSVLNLLEPKSEKNDGL